MSKVDIKKATVNILLTINGEIHMVAMKKDNHEAIRHLIISATENIVSTSRSQAEFNEFLSYKG